MEQVYFNIWRAPQGYRENTVTTILGIWSDCNGDGYIGDAATATWTYSVPPDGVPACQGTRHVSGETVIEIIKIIKKISTNIHNECEKVEYFCDEDVRIWGDVGRPGAPPYYECSTSLSPILFQSTGGWIQYVDCHTAYEMTTETLPALDGRTTLDETFGVDLSFDDPYHPQEDCRPESLNKDLVWGSPHDCDGRTNPLEAGAPRAFTVWDCDSPRMHPGLPNLGISLHDPLSGSYYEGFHHTMEACKDYGGGRPPLRGWGNPMEYHFPLGRKIADGESPGTPTDPKRGNDYHFTTDDNHWRISNAPEITREPRGGLLTGSFEPQWHTFYAHVGPRTLSSFTLPSTAPGIYGAEACNGRTWGVHNGWDCVPDHWIRIPPGSEYHLRDVDCVDHPLQAISNVPACPVVEENAGA